MTVKAKKQESKWRRIWRNIWWFITLLLRPVGWYIRYKKRYAGMMWRNYQMPTLGEAKGNRITLVKNVVKRLFMDHYESRTYPFWTLVPADLSNGMVLLIALFNREKVWEYIMQFVPNGQEKWFYVCTLVGFWLAVELVQTKWGFNLFWYAKWHTAKVGDGTWYTLPPVIVTTISRMIKSYFMLMSSWMVFQALDPRMGIWVAATLRFYWPLLVICAGMYILEGMAFHITLLVRDVTGWIKMVLVAMAMLDAYQIAKILYRVPLPEWKETWNRGTANGSSLGDADWSGFFGYFWHLILYYGPRLIIAGVIIFVIVKLVIMWRKAQDREDDWKEIFTKVFDVLCWTPWVTFILVWGTIGYGYITQVVIPDRLAAQAAQPAPISTSVPVTFTLVPSALPSETLVPAATFTLTSAPTQTPTMVFTATSTVTMTPEPTFTATSTETPAAASGCNLTAEQLSGTPNSDQSTWVDNPYNGRAAYQTIAIIMDSGELCLISNSATFITAGEDSFALEPLAPIAGYTGCEGYVNGAGSFTWKACYVYHVTASKVNPPNLINWLVLKETAKVKGDPVYLVP